MDKKTSSVYASLVSIILPVGILALFEVTQVEEEYTGQPDETGTEIRIIHIYLDERDLRDTAWHDLQPNGFTESRSINDFPIRDHKVVLHVRRRRWLTVDGTSLILNHENLTAEGINALLIRHPIPFTSLYSFIPEILCKFGRKSSLV